MRRTSLYICVLLLVAANLVAGDWARFRGPNGSGVSPDKDPTPTEWSDTKNLEWKLALPGPGLSSPIVVGDKVIVTAWSGYGTDAREPGDQADLKRHVICVDRNTGKELWSKTIDPYLPEDRFGGMFAENGYASHTPTSDGERVYVFFGKTGVLAFDMSGKQLWKSSVGTGSGIRNWGTASSPILYKNVVIVTAAAESESIVGLDKKTGKEVWRQEADLAGLWGTPVIARVDDKRDDLVISVPYEIWGLNPGSGKLRWYVDGVASDSMCSSVILAGGVAYAIESGPRGGGSIAHKVGGKGDSKANTLWSGGDRGRIGTPILVGDNLYYVNNKIVNCLDAKTGERRYQSRLTATSGAGSSNDAGGGSRRGRGGQDYGSPVASGDKIYYVARSGDSFVFQAGNEFKQLAHNRFSDGGQYSATPAISRGEIFIRSSKFLYCISEKK